MTHYAYLIADSVSAGEGERLTTSLLRMPEPADRRLMRFLRGVSMTEGAESMVLLTATEPTLRRLIHTRLAGPLHRIVRDLELALDASTPVPREVGEWHLPFIDGVAFEQAAEYVFDAGPDAGFELDHLSALIERTTIQMSVARCAQLSWSTQFSVADHVNTYEVLLKQGRFDAAEHQATPDTRVDGGGWSHPHYHGSTSGWQQHRKMIVGENLPRLQAAE